MTGVRERIAWVCRIIFDPTHLKRTLLVTLIVGLALSFFNDGGEILNGPWTATLGVKIAVDFCVPFIVVNLGLLSHHSGQNEKTRGPRKESNSSQFR